MAARSQRKADEFCKGSVEQAAGNRHGRRGRMSSGGGTRAAKMRRPPAGRGASPQVRSRQWKSASLAGGTGLELTLP